MPFEKATSVISTSGNKRCDNATAACILLASPITPKSASASRIARRPWRSIVWSSARTTRSRDGRYGSPRALSLYFLGINSIQPTQSSRISQARPHVGRLDHRRVDFQGQGHGVAIAEHRRHLEMHPRRGDGCAADQLSDQFVVVLVRINGLTQAQARGNSAATNAHSARPQRPQNGASPENDRRYRAAHVNAPYRRCWSIYPPVLANP